jgi:3-methyladenine DNA glycosylase AlkD
MSNLKQIRNDLSKLKDSKKAKLLSGFFKTGKGQYGEGDNFLGIVVPKQRKVAKQYNHLGLNELQELLSSKIHEHRLTALFILVHKYKKADNKEKKKIVDFYLKNTKNINNWDLVDLSAPNILGDYLLENKGDILYKLAKSKHLWEKRISVLATFAFIRENDFKDALKIAEILLKDKHDLIHKAVGWMLREVGKRDLKKEKGFLETHYKGMPRTMLRYAIEKFSDKERKHFLTK